MEEVSADESETADEFSEHMEKKEALKGTDLSKLYIFLKAKDENKVLGNLYRTVTDEGHVKWVCIDHYRMNYQENLAKEFQGVLDTIGGSLNENVGKVKVMLWSRKLAKVFYSALGTARSVYELDIDLHWDYTTSDLVALEDALKKSRISIVRLDLQQVRTIVTSGLWQGVWDDFFPHKRIFTNKTSHLVWDRPQCLLHKITTGNRSWCSTGWKSSVDVHFLK
jgi:hypothetical protein